MVMDVVRAGSDKKAGNDDELSVTIVGDSVVTEAGWSFGVRASSDAKAGNDDELSVTIVGDTVGTEAGWSFGVRGDGVGGVGISWDVKPGRRSPDACSNPIPESPEMLLVDSNPASSPSPFVNSNQASSPSPFVNSLIRAVKSSSRSWI
jgi:hypothetical protein